jgi:hypothetical protein
MVRASALAVIAALLVACVTRAPVATSVDIPRAAQSNIDASSPEPTGPPELPPEPETARDDRCTMVATPGYRAIGTGHGCVPCPGAANFVELVGQESSDVKREDIVQRKCTTQTFAETRCTVFYDFLGFEIARRAYDAKLPYHGFGIEGCASGRGYYVTTDDPEARVPLENIVRAVMREWHVRGTMYVQVAPVPRRILL